MKVNILMQLDHNFQAFQMKPKSHSSAAMSPRIPLAILLAPQCPFSAFSSVLPDFPEPPWPWGVTSGSCPAITPALVTLLGDRSGCRALGGPCHCLVTPTSS